jgi:hypothetical protein
MNAFQNMADYVLKHIFEAKNLIPILIEAQYTRKGFHLRAEQRKILKATFAFLTWDNALAG